MATTAINYGTCSGCRNIILNREFLECALCKMKYDINCANISQSRFNSFYALDTDRKRSWKCPECCSKQPKVDNTNSPIQPGARRDLVEIGDFGNTGDPGNLSLHSENVTLRKRDLAKSISLVDCSSEETGNGGDYITETKLRSILQQELAGALRSTIRQLVTAELKNMSGEIKELRESLTFFNKQYEDLKLALDERNALVDNLKRDNDKLNLAVGDLTHRLHLVEQNMRDSNIEINGIPEHRHENLSNVVEQLVKTVDAQVSAQEIVHVTRVSKLSKDSNRPRAVIVKLRTPRQRDAILASVSAFNKKNNKDKLSTQHLGLAGTVAPVFVSEHLSPTNKALHAATRIKAKECKYKFTWVRNGRIFVRKDEFSEALLIRNMDSVASIK